MPEQETKKNRGGGGGKKASSSSSSSKAASASPAPAAASPTASSPIAEIIYSHFDTYQHERKSNSKSNNNAATTRAAAASLRRDLLTSSSPDEEQEEGNNGATATTTTTTIVLCLDTAMCSLLGTTSAASLLDNYMESVLSVWELAASLAFDTNNTTYTKSGTATTNRTINKSGSNSNHKGEEEIMLTEAVAHAIIARAVEYTTLAEKDIVRIQGCTLLGLCVRYLTSKLNGSGNENKTILKKGGKKGAAAGGKVGTTTPSSSLSVSWAALSSWEMECLQSASKALLSRITDKIARVRQAAIGACAPLLPLLTISSTFTSSVNTAAAASTATTTTTTAETKGEAKMVQDTLQSILVKLLWIMSNDTSAANRAAVVSVLPSPPTSSSDEKKDKEAEEEEENDNHALVLHSIIERIKDVDVKVRESALDYLREQIHFVTQLTEDQRVEILRSGLTKRCATTYAKTVELLCTNWLKSMKFDPILLLHKLNPVLNETVCEEVTRILLRVASTLDCAGSSSNAATSAAVDRGVDLVRKQFGGPEVRSLMQIVLQRRNIITTIATANDGRNENETNEEDGISSNKDKDTGLSPSMALFLRVKCESMSDSISDIITDIPTLCNLLNSTIDKLIQFNNNEDYEDMDEDDAAAYEDDQNFVCLQLIHMARASELREEGSRRYFTSIMRRILSRLATPDDLVEACVKAMAAAHDKESQFLQTISEILVDVEDDDSFHSKVQDKRAIVIVRQMRIIAILSIVLESISGHMTSHPILDGFFLHLSPAITSKNAIVREHGVICLSKFCLLSGQDKIMGEFKPLLMMIAGSVAERVEVRAQAALALCDLALIHEKMLLGTATTSSSSDDDEEGDGAIARPNAIPFKDMLFEMLGHSKPGIVIIGAEITAKLLLAGRLSDPELVAWLLVIYFDSSLTMTENGQSIDVVGGADEVAKRVGSPVRLQQLLSIFFPAYSMSSLNANDDMMASVCPLLSIVNEKLSGMKVAEAKDAVVQRFPIAKMVEYVCYNVDLADKKKAGEAAKMVGKKAGDEELSTVIGKQETVSQISEGGDAADKSETYKAELEEKGEVAIEASSILLASIEIAQFLAEECDSAPVLYIRALAKILASACIDVDAEDETLIRQLKSLVSEAEYANEDGPTVKSIKKLAELLVDVNVEDDDEPASSDDESDVSKEEAEEVAIDDAAGEPIGAINETENEEVAIDGDAAEEVIEVSETENEEGSMENAAVVEEIKEKENSRLSIGSIHSKPGTKGDERRASSARTSLSDVICN